MLAAYVRLSAAKRWKWLATVFGKAAEKRFCLFSRVASRLKRRSPRFTFSAKCVSCSCLVAQKMCARLHFSHLLASLRKNQKQTALFLPHRAGCQKCSLLGFKAIVSPHLVWGKNQTPNTDVLRFLVRQHCYIRSFRFHNAYLPQTANSCHQLDLGWFFGDGGRQNRNRNHCHHAKYKCWFSFLGPRSSCKRIGTQRQAQVVSHKRQLLHSKLCQLGKTVASAQFSQCRPPRAKNARACFEGWSQHLGAM